MTHCAGAFAQIANVVNAVQCPTTPLPRREPEVPRPLVQKSLRTLFHHVIDHAKRITEAQRAAIITQNRASIRDQPFLRRPYVSYRKARNRKSLIQIRTHIQYEASRVIRDALLRPTHHLKLHHIGVVVFRRRNIREVDRDEIIGMMHSRPAVPTKFTPHPSSLPKPLSLVKSLPTFHTTPHLE